MNYFLKTITSSEFLNLVADSFIIMIWVVISIVYITLPIILYMFTDDFIWFLLYIILIPFGAAYLYIKTCSGKDIYEL